MGKEQELKKITQQVGVLDSEALKKKKKALDYTAKLLNKTLTEGKNDLVNALLASVQETNPQDATYVEYATELILLTWLWTISNNRNDFETYFKPLLAAHLVDGNALQKWLAAEPYKKEDYEAYFPKDIDNMLTEYEASILATQGFKVWESPLPPIITGARVKYMSPNDQHIYHFSDCVETSFRNFFNFALYLPIMNKFDMTILTNKNHQTIDDIPVKINDQLITFYKKHSTVNNIKLADIYNDWAAILQNLQDVVYVEPVENKTKSYNTKSSLPNMLKICNHMLFGNNPAFDGLERAKQLDIICQALSHEEFDLTWDIDDQTTKKDNLAATDYLTLKFSINKITNKIIHFEWQLMDGHSIIPPVTSGDNRWQVVSRSLLDKLENATTLAFKDYTLMAAFDLQSPRFYVILGNIIKKLKIGFNILFLDQFLDHAEYRIRVILFLYSLKKSKENQELYSLLEQFLKSLASAEIDRQPASELAALILDHAFNPHALFYEAAQITAKNMKNNFCNAWLIDDILRNHRTDWYAIAKNKFNDMIDNYAIGLVVTLIVNKKFTEWYELAQQKIDTMTNEDYIRELIDSIIKKKCESLYPIACQKFNDLQIKQNITCIICSVITNDSITWYKLAQEKFTQLTRNININTIINAIIKKQSQPWYELALQKAHEIKNEILIQQLEELMSQHTQ